MVREADEVSRRLNTPIGEVLKQMRQLPYADMQDLARAVQAEYEQKEQAMGSSTPSDVLMAEALSATAQKRRPPSDNSLEDSRILAKVFSRKRQISVDRVASGWQVSIPTLKLSTVGLDLRSALVDLLDQAVVSRILLGDKK